MKIGCHVSIAGGVVNAPVNAEALGCEVFQIFSRSPRGGSAAKITKEIVGQFQSRIAQGGFKEFVIHTPYYINFGSQTSRIYRGSVQIVREELERGSLLGSRFAITHLGSFKDLGWKKGFNQLIDGLTAVLKGYRGQSKLLLEISAGAGEVIGDNFEELAEIIFHPKLKKYDIGICFDTCHAFASGYDLRTETAVKKTFSRFDRLIGLNKLRAIHINDSKAGLGEHKDRHEHIGMGKIGKGGFAAVLNYPFPRQINAYLETESDRIKEDILALKALRK